MLRSRDMRYAIRVFVLTLVVSLNACDGDTAHRPSPSRPSPNASAAACRTYREFQALADSLGASEATDEEIVARLAGFQDQLEQEALALHRANYAAVGDAALMVSKLIGRLKDAVDSFGAGSVQVRHAMRNIGSLRMRS
jgi:hypothetical protein